MREYFVVTAHWVDSKWMLRHAVLRFLYFPQPHNLSTFSAFLLEILTLFGIQSKVVAITTDNGAEMKPERDIFRNTLTEIGCKMHSEWHIRCVCYILNRSILDAEPAVAQHVAKL